MIPCAIAARRSLWVACILLLSHLAIAALLVPRVLEGPASSAVEGLSLTPGFDSRQGPTFTHRAADRGEAPPADAPDGTSPLALLPSIAPDVPPLGPPTGVGASSDRACSTLAAVAFAPRPPPSHS